MYNFVTGQTQYAEEDHVIQLKAPEQLMIPVNQNGVNKFSDFAVQSFTKNPNVLV